MLVKVLNKDLDDIWINPHHVVKITKDLCPNKNESVIVELTTGIFYIHTDDVQFRDEIFDVLTKELEQIINNNEGKR